ncbi:MAG: hypothetical protein WC285_03765 [Candidatus Gracilibacteria bacterium]|jgi:hypothetical protein
MSKSKKVLSTLIVLLLIGAGAGWGAYYLKNPSSPKSDVPPVLKLTDGGDVRFQALISTGDLIFKTVSPSDIRYRMTSFEASGLDDSPARLNPGVSSSITTGAAYYYSPEDLTAGQILGLILDANSTPNNSFLLAYYDRSINKYRINPPAGDDELQSLIFEEAGIEDLPNATVIHKFHPFVVYAKFPTDSPSLIYSTKVSLDEISTLSSMVNLVGNLSPSSGWYIIPTKKNVPIDEFLDPIKDYVNGYYPQTANGTFGNVCHVETPCSGLDLENFTFIWLDIGRPGAGVIPNRTPPTPFCEVKDCVLCSVSTCSVACDGILCDHDEIPMTVDSIFRSACITQPELCVKYDIPFQPIDYTGYFNDNFLDPGVIDPVPFENNVKDLFSDPIAAGGFVGINTTSLTGKISTSARNNLATSLATNVSSQATNLAKEVMSNDFSRTLQQSTNLQNAYATIQAFEAENDVEVSVEEAAGFIGAALEQSLSESFTEQMNNPETLEAAVSETLSSNTTLRTGLRSSVSSAFSASSSIFSAAGLRFNPTSGSFSNVATPGE